jgi:hypothetical protein
MYSYVLVFYSYVTRMYTCVTRMLLVCTRVLVVCTRMYLCVTRMLLVWCFSHDPSYAYVYAHQRFRCLCLCLFHRVNQALGSTYYRESTFWSWNAVSCIYAIWWSWTRGGRQIKNVFSTMTYHKYSDELTVEIR